MKCDRSSAQTIQQLQDEQERQVVLEELYFRNRFLYRAFLVQKGGGGGATVYASYFVSLHVPFIVSKCIAAAVLATA